jgi:hypothetical protein
MKTNAAKLLVTFLVISGTIGFSKAQNFFDPVFIPATTVVDFGEVDAKTDPGFRMLTFTNEGGSPLTITNAIGSCGCTVPDWPKEPIKPGKSAQIKISYQMSKMGTIDKTVTITTNEPEGKDADGNVIFKQHKIQVKGNVK